MTVSATYMKNLNKRMNALSDELNVVTREIEAEGYGHVTEGLAVIACDIDGNNSTMLNFVADLEFDKRIQEAKGHA